MNYHEKCACCGHRVTAYTLHLNRKIVEAFIKFADARIRLGRPVSKGELGLTNGQYGNFQNLRHFGIIIQHEKAGPWEITPLGLRFLAGVADLPTPVAHMDGKTLDEDDLKWSTHDGKRSRKTIREVMPEDWKTREEYQLEKWGKVA